MIATYMGFPHAETRTQFDFSQFYLKLISCDFDN